MALSAKKRVIIARTAIIVIYLGLAAVMFITGRTHTVLIDNKNAADGSYKAYKGMVVTVGKSAPSEFMRGDRDKFSVKGQKAKIHVEFYDGTEDLDVTVRIPFTEDCVLVSIPAYTAGNADYVQPFSLYGTAD